jgi:hypothetical protein
MDAGAIENDPSVIFVLDAAYRFRLCNAAWDRFARENGGESVVGEVVLGRSVFDYILGAVARHYRRAFERTLQQGALWSQEYECSSPHVYRRFLMSVYPIQGELLVVNSLCVERPHEGGVLSAVEERYRNAGGMVVMCSNCRKTQTSGPEQRWDWAPGFVSEPPLNVSHGLCPACFEYYANQLGS